MKDQEGTLTMVIINGIFMIGKMIGGNKLTKPRIFITYMEEAVDESKPHRPKIIDPGTGKPTLRPMIRMELLPGTPPFVRIGIEACSYPVPERPENKTMFDLYERVTNPAVYSGV
jgi:hypothetical protein